MTLSGALSPASALMLMITFCCHSDGGGFYQDFIGAVSLGYLVKFFPIMESAEYFFSLTMKSSMLDSIHITP